MLTVENTSAWLINFATKINDNKEYLSQLDSAIGDGDHGSNMVRGTEAMSEKLKEANPSSVNEILKLSGMQLLSKIGGASGPLYGSAFISMAKQSDSDETDLILILKEGLKAIQLRGKAELGEKTMIDVWFPAIEALERNDLSKDVIGQAVQSTKDLKATKGRASYLGDRSIGHIDAGAVSSSLLFEALLEGEIIDE